MHALVRAALASAFFFAVSAAQATLLQYELHASFNDGGQANGSFTLDTVTGNPTVWDITTTAVSPSFPSSFQYTNANSSIFLPNPDPTQGLINTGFETAGKVRQVQFFFDPALGNGVNSASVIGGDEIFHNDVSNPSNFVERFVPPTGGGTVTAVPEPSSVAFLGLGLGLLVLARRLVH